MCVYLGTKRLGHIQLEKPYHTKIIDNRFPMFYSLKIKFKNKTGNSYWL